MLDNDNLTYSYQKRAVRQPAERALITLERSQKLDLLIHLLINLQQSLIVCGPDGIGKTTLLQTLRDSRADHWHFCNLSGSPALSFESAMQQLSRSLNLSGSGIGFDLSALRAFCGKQKVVLIVDDAGELVPGLIGELAAFAESLNGLRLVLAMTHDQFHIKSNSDKALDECHLIEIPPLNRKQCLEYLQNLSAQPGMGLSFNAVTDALVDELYRETSGVPGKLLAELPKLNQYQSRQQHRWGVWLGAVVVAVAAAGVAVWYLSPELRLKATIDELPAPKPQSMPTEAKPVADHAGGDASDAGAQQPLDHTPVTAELESAAPPLAELPVTEPQILGNGPGATSSVSDSAKPAAMTMAPQPKLPATPLSGDLNAAIAGVESVPQPANTTSEPAPSPANAAVNAPATPFSAARAEAAKSAPVNTPEPVATPETAKPATTKSTEVAKAADKADAGKDKKPDAKAIAADASDREWIMAQPPGNYTLQVMTLSTKDAVRRFMKKYADYGDSLKYYTINQNGQEKFILIYGSFQSSAEARQYKEVMPGEFKQALEKRFKAVQKESR